MKNCKSFYLALPKTNGYKWSFYDNGLHSFIKGNNRTGYMEIKLKEEDIHCDINFHNMLTNNITRTK